MFFILGLQFLFWPLFLDFFIYYIWIYIYIYITHVWIYWSFYVWFGWWQKKRFEARLRPRKFDSTLVVCTYGMCECTPLCVCVCVRAHVHARMCVHLCQHNHSFLFCWRCCSQTRRDHLRFLTSPQRLCCLAHSFCFHGTDGQTTRDFNGVTWILIFWSLMETQDNCPARVAVSSATIDSISSWGSQQIEKLNGFKTKLNAFDKKV